MACSRFGVRPRLDLRIPILNVALVCQRGREKGNVFWAADPAGRNAGEAVASCFGDSVIPIDQARLKAFIRPESRRNGR
jgi:hypothetical protein